MDDKTFMAKYVADESVRIKERLKNMVESPTPPTEEEKAAVMADLNATLARLQKALSQIALEDADSETKAS